MKATYHKDGTVTLRMSRAEAHVAIWGGKQKIVDAVGWNLRHALVAAEDRVSEEAYAAITDEVDALVPTFEPDPREILEASA